jgi:hypothetical protein
MNALTRLPGALKARQRASVTTLLRHALR